MIGSRMERYEIRKNYKHGKENCLICSSCSFKSFILLLPFIQPLPPSINHSFWRKHGRRRRRRGFQGGPPDRRNRLNSLNAVAP